MRRELLQCGILTWTRAQADIIMRSYVFAHTVLLCSFPAIITMILFQLRKQIELDFIRLSAVAFACPNFKHIRFGRGTQLNGLESEIVLRVFTLHEIHTQET